MMSVHAVMRVAHARTQARTHAHTQTSWIKAISKKPRGKQLTKRKFLTGKSINFSSRFISKI